MRKKLKPNIEVFKITSKINGIYQELLEQYKTNSEVQALLNEPIFNSDMMAGDFRLITMLNHAIEIDSIEVYLVKDIDNDVFMWVIGKFLDDGNISMYPLLNKQSKDLQLAIRDILVKKGIMTTLH